MFEEKVRMTATVPIEYRDYIKNRNVKLREIIAEWVSQDKINGESKRYQIYNMQKMIEEIQDFIGHLNKVQDKYYDKMNVLEIEEKKSERKKSNLLPAKRKIIAKWNKKQENYKTGLGVFTPVSKEYVKKVCSDNNVLFEDLYPLLPKEIKEEGLEGFGKYKHYSKH